MVIDIWPLNYPMAIIINHDIAEQISRASKNYPYGTPKSPTMKYLNPIIGKHSLVSINVSPALLSSLSTGIPKRRYGYLLGMY